MKYIYLREDIERFSYDNIIDIEYYLNHDIINLILDNKIYHEPEVYDFNKVRENSVNFYNDFFNIQNIYQVYYLPKSTLLKIYRYYILNQIYHSNQKISPFDLPIKLCNNPNDCGVNIYYHHIDNDLNIPIFRNITFPKMNYTKSITELYIHEICHTQTPPLGLGLLADINDELFPIFTELLYSIKYNDGKMIYFRLNNLIKLINRYKEFQDTNMYLYLKGVIKYIESTLKALMLLYLYDTETNTSKKAMIIDDIQAIFDKNLSIDEFLIKYDINEKDYKSPKFIKHYVR